MSGLTADSRTMIERARVEAQVLPHLARLAIETVVFDTYTRVRTTGSHTMSR